MTLFNGEVPSPAHHLSSRPALQHTNLFLTEAPEIREAIKCFEFNTTEKHFDVFGKALKECFFTKIASGLGVGPRFTRHSGFDLVLHDNCIEFSMEKCSEVVEHVA